MADEQEGSQTLRGIEVIKITERVREENYTRIYANNIQVGFSSWDMRITFGELVDGPDGSLTKVAERATVTMSLHHAKAAIHVLMEQLTALEKQFGEIPLLNTMVGK